MPANDALHHHLKYVQNVATKDQFYDENDPAHNMIRKRKEIEDGQVDIEGIQAQEIQDKQIDSIFEEDNTQKNKQE